MAHYAYKDDRGKAAGTYVDLMTYTFKHYKLANKLHYHRYKNFKDMIDDFQKKKLDMFVPCIGDAWQSEKMGIIQSINMDNTTISLVKRKKESQKHILAVINQTPINKNYLKKELKGYKKVSYKSIKDCVKAVRLGEADATLLNAFQVTIYLHSDDDLIEKPLDYTMEMALAISPEYRYLLDVVNRGIVNWRQQNINESLLYHTDAVQEITLSDFIKTHYLSVITLVAVLAAAFALLINGWMYTRRRRRLAEEAANNDLLTGLYSRRAYDEDLDHFVKTPDMNYTVVAIDANGLKNVNDHLGHHAGDEMLMGIATCIKATMHDHHCQGKAYRIGGDEFMILLEEHKRDDSLYEDFAKRLSSWHGELLDHITVSFGYASSSEFPGLSLREIAVKADERMYHQKHRDGYDENALSREDYDIYKRVLQLYKDDRDATTQLPGSLYFSLISGYIREEISKRGICPVIAAIHLETDRLEKKTILDISDRLIQMFGKENLAYFDDHYYVITAEIELDERLQKVYQDIKDLVYSSVGMSVGAYIIGKDDHTDIRQISKLAREAASSDQINTLQIHYVSAG